MVELTVLRSKYIPYGHLDTFNQKVGTQVPDSRPDPRHRLLYRTYFGTNSPDIVSVLQARETLDGQGFYVGLAFTPGLERVHSGVQDLNTRMGNAVKSITGKDISPKIESFDDAESKFGYKVYPQYVAII